MTTSLRDGARRARYGSRRTRCAWALCVAVLCAGAVVVHADGREAEPRLAYAEAGLDESQAAAILLDRFTFGARPGEVERIRALGPARWFALQLGASAAEPELAGRLSAFPALVLSDEKLATTYPSSSMVSAHARRYFDIIPARDVPVLDFSVVRTKLKAFSAAQGFRDPEAELEPQLRGQKLVRAVHAENQLREVLVDFWQNHFFTSVSSFRARMWVLGFEESAVRPHVLGSFRELLRATAKHPAMLEFYSGGEEPAALGAGPSAMAVAEQRLRAGAGAAPAVREARIAQARAELAALDDERDLILERKFWPPTGPNEARARALIELQTLGPEGPQTDGDVREAARALTGWMAHPRGASGQWFAGEFAAARELGVVREGSFLFRPDQHDAGAKHVLELVLPAGAGLEDCERLLDHLARHPSTARHVARKLAVRFAGEEPPEALIDALAQSFASTGGDLRAVLRTLAASPEFWRVAARRDKVKNPFEYAVSALRTTGASVREPEALAAWIARMGQPLYGYLEVDGVPESGAYWLDPGSLQARVRFAQALVQGAIDGVSLDVPRTGEAGSGLAVARMRQIAGPEFQRR